MGYYTFYTLEVYDKNAFAVSSENIKRQVAYELSLINPFEFEGIETVEDVSNTNRKWYESDEDMKALSIKFPDYVFCLRGQGEDSLSDLWQSFFKDGEMVGGDGYIQYEVPESVAEMFESCDLSNFSGG